jgi:putative ABC transport system permease protein
VDAAQLARLDDTAPRLLQSPRPPLGKTFEYYTSYTVVGVMADLPFGSLDAPASAVFTTASPIDDLVGSELKFTIRSDRPEALRKPAERAIAGVFADAPLVDVATGREVIARDLGRQRLGAWLLSGFGLVAMTLGVGGVFGLVAYLAESRRREFGVRVALGATPRDLMRRAMGAALGPVAAGTGAGLLAAALLARFVASVLVGVSRFDPLSYAAAALLMLACAAAAGLVAAWGLRRITPGDALRAE